MKRLCIVICLLISMHGFSQSTISKELFPTLAGLQRTVCSEYCDEDNLAYLVEAPSKTKYINEKLYVRYGGFYLREEGKRIFIYSYIQQKDLLLYDFTLQVGDSLPRLYTDWSIENEEYGNVVDYPTMTGYVNPILVVDLSEVTLLNGKKYKKWTFNNGMEYVENIGAYSHYKYAGDFFQLIADIPLPCHMSSRLICVSIDGMLLYQLDEAEMDSLGVECLCDGYQSSYKSQWCDTWNVFVKNVSVYPPHEETYRYQLAEDIVIGEHTYTAVVSKAINDALDAPHYVAAVRFTDDRKVYIYYDNAEYLLYDFNVQEGDELEVFAGINNYTSDIKTYKCTVTGVEQYACVGCPATITLEVHNHPDDFREFYRQTQWIEGVGDINGFLNGINGYINIPGNAAEYLLCAYQGDELKYTGDLYEEYGCGDNAELTPENLFPTLWGLQRTSCDEWFDGCEENKSYLCDTAGRSFFTEKSNRTF